MTRRAPQTRLVPGALVLLVALVAVLGGWQVVAARSSQRHEIENGEVTAAHLASSALAAALESRLELISNLASQPSVAKLFQSGNTKQLAGVGSALHLLYPGFSSFVMLSGTGRLVGRWPVSPSQLGKDLASSGTYVGVERSGRPYVGAAHQQTTAPYQLVVGLAAPVDSATGKLVGVLEATLSARTLGSVIGGTALAGGGSLVVIDQQGHALTGPGANASRSFSSDSLVSAGLGGRSGAATGAAPGFSGNRLVGYAAVPSIGWAVLAEQPPSALDAPIDALTERLIAIGLIVLLLAAGTALLVGRLLRQLTHEHERAAAVLASVGEGVTTLDLAGRPTQVNPALEGLTGRNAGDLIGAEWLDALQLFGPRGQAVDWPGSTAARAIAERRVIATSGFDLHLARPGGERVPVAVTAAPLLVGEELTGAVVVLRDVSREREVDQLKSSLVSTVSHELRTPLTMIQGFSELLLSRELGAERSREALEQVHSSAQRLGRLIDDLLSVSRIDSGKLTVELAVLDVTAVADEVVVAFADARVESSTGPGLPPVLADRDKLVQILTNLVSNALKYSPAPNPVSLTANVVGDHIELAVADRGIGMSEEERVRVFEKFNRVDRPEVRQVGGTGLGLYITKSLIELQHGQLWVQSEPGVGSTFSFSLPIARRAAPDRAEPPADVARPDTAEPPADVARPDRAEPPVDAARPEIAGPPADAARPDIAGPPGPGHRVPQPSR
jgi:PAS domain S-box-containing protein